MDLLTLFEAKYYSYQIFTNHDFPKIFGLNHQHFATNISKKGRSSTVDDQPQSAP
jgi:hypothetical protein